MKMKKADLFVFLGHCQYEARGYQNRFEMGARWYTMSVKSGRMPIIKQKYVDHNSSWNKIKHNAIKYSGIDLNKFNQHISDSLYNTNVRIILHLKGLLDINTQIGFDYPTTLTGTDRLVDICKHFGATKYLSGPSGANYLETEKFYAEGIRVDFFHTKNISPVLNVL
jgi:hypothetical protein